VVSPSTVLRTGLSNHERNEGAMRSFVDGLRTSRTWSALPWWSTERVDAWFETAALDLRSRRRLLTTNGFWAMLIKRLPFVVSPTMGRLSHFGTCPCFGAPTEAAVV